MPLVDALQLAERRYRAKLPRWKQKLQSDVAQILTEAGPYGILPSSGVVDRLFERCSLEVDQRVRTAWDDCRTSVEAASVSASADLSTQLRQWVRTLTAELLQDQQLYHPVGSIAPLNIEAPYREALTSVDVEIDLFVRSHSRTSEPSVFISHIKEDKEIAGALKALLGATCGTGLHVFVASDYDSISGGEEWRRAILQAIRRAPVMIALLSNDSHNRPWINYEVGAADALDKLVIPSVIRGLAKGELRPPVMDRQARSLVDPADVRALVRDVARRLKVDLLDADPMLVSAVASQASVPQSGRGLSQSAIAVARLLCERAEHAIDPDPVLRAADIARTLGVEVDDLKLSLDELEEHKWIVVGGDANSEMGLGRVSATLPLLVGMDPMVHGWQPLKDADALLEEIGRHAESRFLLSNVDGTLEWGPRRLNVAARVLVDAKLIEVDAGFYGGYAFRGGQLLPKGRRALRSADTATS